MQTRGLMAQEECFFKTHLTLVYCLFCPSPVLLVPLLIFSFVACFQTPPQGPFYSDRNEKPGWKGTTFRNGTEGSEEEQMTIK